MDADFQSWLEAHGLAQHAETFAANDVDFRALAYLNEDDLKELGLSLGHRRIMLAAIDGLKQATAAGVASVPDRAVDEVIAPTGSGGVAERRQLTVMFCDLVGSTELSRRLDPEELRDVLRRYQNAVASAVIGYDGYVARFLGDGVLAYFGWPRAHEDQAERAVRAAIDVIAGVEGVKLDNNVSLGVRIGIASGEVVVGELIGDATSDSESVIGETPNLAARLQSVANPGKIVISESTHSLVGTAFEIENIGRFDLKGFDEPVAAWRVLGVAAVESRFEAAHGADLTDLVGREHELGLLRERWELAKRREGQVVLLSGEAGIGKSRTVQDFRKQVGVQPCFHLHYQCSPHHTNSAFHAVVHQLRREAGFSSDDSGEAKLDKLEAYLRKNDLDTGKVGPVFAALLSLPAGARYGDFALTPQQLRSRIIEVLIEQMLDQSRRQPVLCVIEDVHWSDPSIGELIGEVMPRIADQPIYVLITYRPDFTPPWPDYAHVSVLTLNRLGRGQAAEIVQSVAGPRLLDAIVEQIVVRSDGIPLFVEELTKTVLETVTSKDESPIDEIIPATLQSSLVARLDRLEDAKETAQVCAVIGREFSHDLLRAVVDKSEQQLLADLDRLVMSGLVIRRGMPPNATYTFKHSLVQDAAYTTILMSRRLHLHAKIVDALEAQTRVNTVERIDTLAYHAQHAELWEKAFDYSHQAGVKAMDRAGVREAVAQFEQALRVAVNLPETKKSLEQMIDLRFELRNALWTLGRFEDILTYLGDSEGLVQKLGDPVRRGWVSVFESASLWQLGRWEQALRTAEGGLGVSKQTDDLSLGVAAHFYLGCPLVTSGQYRRAETVFSTIADMLEGEASLDRCGLPFVPSVISRSWLAWSLAERGEFEAGMAHGMEALRIAKEVGHPFNLAHIYYDLGYFYEIRGDIPKAVEALETAAQLVEEWNLAYLSPFIRGFLGHVYALAGRTDDGIAILRDAQDRYTAMGLGLFRSLVGMQLGEAYLIAGQSKEALSTTRQAVTLARKRGERGHEAFGLRVLGDIAVASAAPDVDEALGRYEQSLALAEQLEMRPLMARCQRRLAKLHARAGRENEASRLSASATKVAEEIGMAFLDVLPDRKP
ncbi:MAG: adenylate/guanylate cyclase domain-containing protein [Geminicoccaceae bacterium]